MLPQHIAPPDANRNRLTNRNRNAANSSGWAAPMGNYAAHRGRATKVALKPAASALAAVEVAPPQTTDNIIMVAKKAAPAVTSSGRGRVRSQTAHYEAGHSVRPGAASGTQRPSLLQMQ